MLNFALVKSPKNWLFITAVFLFGLLVLSILADLFNKETE